MAIMKAWDVVFRYDMLPKPQDEYKPRPKLDGTDFDSIKAFKETYEKKWAKQLKGLKKGEL